MPWKHTLNVKLTRYSTIASYISKLVRICSIWSSTSARYIVAFILMNSRPWCVKLRQDQEERHSGPCHIYEDRRWEFWWARGSVCGGWGRTECVLYIPGSEEYKYSWEIGIRTFANCRHLGFKQHYFFNSTLIYVDYLKHWINNYF